MADLFISYAREDRDFVVRLGEALRTRGREPWVDWQDIPPSAAWMEEICAGVEASHALVFVLSPHSVASEVCRQELEHAVKHNKRLVPVVCAEVQPDEVPPTLASLNWIFIRPQDGFEPAVDTLVSALDTDLPWVHAHTRLLGRALEWSAHGRDAAYVLRGSDLREAEGWLQQAGARHEPRPTPLQVEYILASRRSQSRRQRLLFSMAAAAVAIAAILGLLAWQHREASRLNLARRFHEAATFAIADGDLLAAETLLAHALTLDDRHETRERLIECRVRTPRLLRTTKADAGSRLLAAAADAWLVRTADGRLQWWDAAGPHPIDARGDWDCASISKGVAAVGGADVALCTLQGLNQIAKGRAARLALSPDGRTLAVAYKGGRVDLVEVTSGKSRRLGGEREVNALAWSPRGDVLALGGWDEKVELWDVARAARLHVLALHEDAILSLAFSPDGAMLACGSWDTRMSLWDVQTGRLLQPLEGHQGGIWALAFSPDGRLLASGSEDKTVRLWDMRSRRCVLQLRGLTAYVKGVAFSADGVTLMTAGDDGSTRAWDMARLVRTPEAWALRGHAGPVNAVAFDAEGRRLASGGRDGTLRTWDAASGENLATLRRQGRIMSVAFAPDGRLALCGGSSDVAVWTPGEPSARVLGKHDEEAVSVAFNHAGTVLASGGEDGAIRLWHDNEQRARLLVKSATRHRGLAFSPDDRLIAAADGDEAVRVWQVQDGRPVAELKGHERAVWDVAWSPDGRRLASASDDGTARMWDVSAQRELSRQSTGQPVWSVAWTRDLQVLALAGQDASLRCFEDGRPPLVLRGAAGPLWTVRFGAADRLLAAAGQDGTIWLWRMDAVRALLRASPEELARQAEEETGLRVEGMEVVPR